MYYHYIMSFDLEKAIHHFLNEKVDEAIQIQITERKSNGRGVFFVEFKDATNVDCYYIPFHDKKFPQQYLSYFRERVEDSKLDSVLFFIFYHEDKQQILELDLDRRNAEQNTSIDVVSEK